MQEWFRQVRFFTREWRKMGFLILFIYLILLQTHSFLRHKTVFNGLETCGLLVNYCDVFISCLDSHSDGTHSLQMIHFWGSDVGWSYFSSNLFPWRNKLIYILDGLGGVHCKPFFLFFVNCCIPLKVELTCICLLSSGKYSLPKIRIYHICLSMHVPGLIVHDHLCIFSR